MEGSEIPQVISDPVEYFDSNDRVLALMDLRRNAVQTQQQADEQKATLCNKIRSLMNLNLRARIVAISEVDPELSSYIMALESINAGIWCAKCKTAKKFVVGATPETSQSCGQPAARGEAPSNVSVRKDESFSLECTKLLAHINTAKEEVQLIKQAQNSLNTRADLLTIKIESYQKRLDELFRTVEGGASRITSEVPKARNEPQKETQRHPLLDIKKEDLPPAPTLDISVNIEEVSSADSLLE